MSKAKLFLENFFVYGVGGVICKIVPLILVPVITRLFPDTTYFGLNDMQGTLVAFTSALATLGMGDAMYRMFFEKDDIEYKQSVCSTTLVFTFVVSFIVSLLLLLFKKQIGIFFFGSDKYDVLIYFTAMSTFIGATNGIISAPTRMENKRKTFVLFNTLTPIVCYAIAIPLLMHGYYLVAIPLAYAVTVLIIEVSFYLLNKKWFKFTLFDFKLLKLLLPIAIPLIPNLMIYWLFDACNKVMITKALSISDSGIYAIASKFGHMSQLIQTAFAGGWQFYAFSTMRDNDQVKSNSLIFEYLGVVSYVATMIMCCFSFFLHKLLFVGDYVNGYIVAPYLFITPLLLMIFQTASNQFVIIKKTWPNLVILGGGVVLNLVLDYFFIPVFGIEGAGLATVVSYLLTVGVCVLVLYRMHLMNLSFRFFICTLLMAVFFVIWRLYLKQNTLGGCVLTLVVSVLMLLFYRKDVLYFASRLLEKFRKK